MAAYEKARAEWKRTTSGGLHFTFGPKTTTASFVTADGAWARGVASDDGKRWRWTEATWRKDARV